MVAVACSIMTDRRSTLLVQELIRSFERVSEFASDYQGLPEEECKAVLLCARGLIRDLESHCVERRHQHNNLGKRAA
jgi:hypothetical protein